MAGYYVFDPFTFGTAYYIIYQFNHLPGDREESQKVLLLGIIGLLYVSLHFLNEVGEKRFMRKFEIICSGPKSSEVGICDAVKSALESSKVSLGSSDNSE